MREGAKVHKVQKYDFKKKHRIRIYKSKGFVGSASFCGPCLSLKKHQQQIQNTEIQTCTQTKKAQKWQRKGGACVAGPRMGLRNNLQPKQQQQQQKSQNTNVSEYFIQCVWAWFRWGAVLSFLQFRAYNIGPIYWHRVRFIVGASEWVGFFGQLGPRNPIRVR